MGRWYITHINVTHARKKKLNRPLVGCLLLPACRYCLCLAAATIDSLLMWAPCAHYFNKILFIISSRLHGYLLYHKRGRLQTLPPHTLAWWRWGWVFAMPEQLHFDLLSLSLTLCNRVVSQIHTCIILRHG